MSRETYAGVPQRSPRMSRRQEMATLGQGLAAKSYTSTTQSPAGQVSSVASRVHSSPSQIRKNRVSRSSNNSPLNAPPNNYISHSLSGSAFHASQGYYSDDPDSPVMDVRTSSSAQNSGHRSRSITRGTARNYHSLERDQERGFVPVREPRERSLDRVEMNRHSRGRERSLERSGYRDREMERDPYYRDRETALDVDGYARDSGHHIPRTTHTSSAPTTERHSYSRDNFILEIQSRLNDLQSQYDSVKRELDVTTQKLGSSMHSIKTFWSPELKKERALRKEEAAKYTLINDQLKILRSENQKLNQLIKQLEEDLRTAHIRNPETEVQQHLEALYSEKDHMKKEIFLLRETIKELEMRIETQKQTLNARDESIKKLMEMLQNKGVGGKMLEEEKLEVERLKARLAEEQNKSRHFGAMLENRERELGKIEELRIELNRRDQEILGMGAKMRTLEEQHQDYQRHIAVLKESLCAKEEHYNMLQADVEELRMKLEEKNQIIEKKTQQTTLSTQEKNKLTHENQELRDHMEIKDRKINVLQRKAELQNLRSQQNDSNKISLVHNSELATLQKQLEEKQNNVDILEKELKKLKEALAYMEQERKQAGLGQHESLTKEIVELRQKNSVLEKLRMEGQKEVEKFKEEAKHSSTELERLLQIMSNMEEEKFSLNKQIQDLQNSLREKESKLNNIKRSQQTEKTKSAQLLEEARLREGELSKESAKAQEQALQQLQRIEELEEGLRESVRITVDREVALAQKESLYKEAETRICKLVVELKALQNAHNARCTKCPILKVSLKNKESELQKLVSERKCHLEETFEMKQKALSAALSEKDAHLAWLEVSGIKNAQTAEQVDKLKAEKRQIMDKMKSENENRMRLLKEIAENFVSTNGKIDWEEDANCENVQEKEHSETKTSDTEEKSLPS